MKLHEIRCHFREVGRATVPADIGQHGGRPYFNKIKITKGLFCVYDSGVLESQELGSRIADFGLKLLQSDQIHLKIRNPKSQIRNRISPMALSPEKLTRMVWAILISI